MAEDPLVSKKKQPPKERALGLILVILGVALMSIPTLFDGDIFFGGYNQTYTFFAGGGFLIFAGADLFVGKFISRTAFILTCLIMIGFLITEFWKLGII